MISAGELKHRFKIEINAKTLDDQGGFDSEWSTLGYFWAKVDNKALRSKNEHGEYINTQDMTLHIRQKQRFDISPMTTRDYRLTDKRGNQYRVVNFEQSDFDLDFYKLVCEQSGATNTETPAPSGPCAGATQSVQILSVDGQYDVYIDDTLIVSGGYDAIFETLLFAHGMAFDTSGVLISYRDDTTQVRFERTDAGTINFDALDNPTASLVGNVLSFCLLGKPFGSAAIIYKQAGLYSAPDQDGFITVSPDPATCATSGAGFLAAAGAGEAVIQYRLPDLAPDNVHGIAEFPNDLGSGRLTFQNRATDGKLLLSWSLGFGLVQIIDAPIPVVGTIITLQVTATNATVSYAGYSESLNHPAGFKPLQLPALGFVWEAALARGLDESLTSCDRQPMKIKI